MENLIMPGGIPKINASTDPRNYDTIHCSKCGAFRFVSQLILKRIPGVEAGTGSKPAIGPMSVLVCANCGAIYDMDVSDLKLEKDIEIEQNFNKK